MNEYQQLAASAAMMVFGAVGVYARRNTVGSLYLDARIWLKQRFGAPREERAVQQHQQLLAQAPAEGEQEFAQSYVDEPTGLTVRVWVNAADGEPMSAVGADAAYPASSSDAVWYQRVSCPFVLLTYINDREEEYILNVDHSLWYRKEGRSSSGLPKFTQDEVRYLIGRTFPDKALDSMWTPEYTLECTTADGKDVVIDHTKVFWTARSPLLPAADDVVVEEMVPAEDEEEEEMMDDEERMDDEEKVFQRIFTVLKKRNFNDEEVVAAFSPMKKIKAAAAAAEEEEEEEEKKEEEEEEEDDFIDN